MVAIDPTTRSSTSDADDAILALIPADRRATLIARRAGDDAYEPELVLQGDNEPVLLDV